MHDAGLGDRLGPYGGDRVGQPAQGIAHKHQHVVHAPVRSSVSTCSQCLAPSLPSPTHDPRMSRLPSHSSPRARRKSAGSPPSCSRTLLSPRAPGLSDSQWSRGRIQSGACARSRSAGGYPRAGGASRVPFYSFNLSTGVGDDPGLSVAADRRRLASAIGSEPIRCGGCARCMARPSDPRAAAGPGISRGGRAVTNCPGFALAVLSAETVYLCCSPTR